MCATEARTVGRQTDSMKRLDRAVEQLIKALSAEKARAAKAESKLEDTRKLLRSFKSGKEDPSSLAERLKQLEEENGDLRDRLERGRASVTRLLARVRFIEEKG